jgi:hypothetical protein
MKSVLKIMFGGEKLWTIIARCVKSGIEVDHEHNYVLCVKQSYV